MSFSSRPPTVQPRGLRARTSEVDRSFRDGPRKVVWRVELRASPEQKDAIYRSILGSSHIDIEYAALLIVAGLIALLGLLENSAPVIIGAMLISPLMNPILAAALALLLGDGKLGRRSAIVLALSVAAVIAVTCLAAFAIPLKQATPQILARTTPNLLDLFIAVLSGLAGTLALRGGSVAMTILPGVAIAVAVVPPFSVVGYGLSTHQGLDCRRSLSAFYNQPGRHRHKRRGGLPCHWLSAPQRSRARPVEAEIPSWNQHLGIDSSFHPALSNSASSRHRDSRTVPFAAGAEGLL